MDTLDQPHVLVLDPDPSMRVLLAATLQRRRLRVTVCLQEREAADHCLHRGRYSVVLVSSDMPAFEPLLAEINATPPAERPAIIVLTTSEVALPALHVDAVLLEPLRLDDLDRAVASCCRAAGEERSPRRDDSRVRTAAGASVEIWL